MKNSKNKKLIIFGTGSFAKTCKKYFDRYTDYEFTNFIYDGDSYSNEDYVNLKLVESVYPPTDYIVFVAVGYTKMNCIREKYFKTFKNMGYVFANFVHPNVVWWDDSELGGNCFIFENNVVQSNCLIEDNVILWSGNHIGHDTTIGCNSWITSHVVIYSKVFIGNNSFIGSNVNIRDSLKVGKFNFIGAGSNVWKSSEAYSFFPVNQTKESMLNEKIMMGLI